MANGSLLTRIEDVASILPEGIYRIIRYDA